jgi:hypothetical protein
LDTRPGEEERKREWRARKHERDSKRDEEKKLILYPPPLKYFVVLHIVRIF